MNFQFQNSTFAQLPRWVVMWSLAVAIYAALKLLSWAGRDRVAIPRWKALAYLLGWPGMDVNQFLNSKEILLPLPDRREWLLAWAKLGFGIVLLILMSSGLFTLDPYFVGWAEMIGLVFVLHFGSFYLLALFWRRYGLEAVPIMDCPIASQSLTEFWGRRWNRAFRDLMHRFLFLPLLRFIGPRGALVTGFLVSGLIHDVVISFPAGGGYGGPTLFFQLQAVGILIERSWLGKMAGLGHGIAGRLFCAAFLIAPAGLLFHRPFVCNIIVPFVRALRVLP